MDITLENYEFAFFQYEEGLLSTEERKQVEAFCQEHPELGEELQLAMECPRLEPLSVETPATRRAIIVPLWAKRALSAAACVGLLIGIGVQLWGPVPDPEAAQQPRLVAENRPTEPQPGPKVSKDLKDFKDSKDLKDPKDFRDFFEPKPAPEPEAPAAWEEAPSTFSEPEPLYAEGFIQQVDSEEFQLLLAQNYIEASEMLALSADEPAPKSEEELSHPISTWLARQKEAALMQLAEFFTQKFNH